MGELLGEEAEQPLCPVAGVRHQMHPGGVVEEGSGQRLDRDLQITGLRPPHLRPRFCHERSVFRAFASRPLRSRSRLA